MRFAASKSQWPEDPAVDACVNALSEWADDYITNFVPSSSSAPTLEDVKEFLTPATLRRYAVARNADVDAARKNLIETLEWRTEHVPDKLWCSSCEEDEHSHCFFPVGVDDSHRLTIYACAARAKTNEKTMAVRHMVQTLEHAWRSTDELDLHPQWLWLIDFSGFSFWHAMQGSTSNAVLASFSAHLPERLGNAILINPPGVFDILLAAMRPFIDARTMSKVHIVRCTPETAAKAFTQFGIKEDSEIAKWMELVMAKEAKPSNLPPLDVLNQPLLKAIKMSVKEPGPRVRSQSKQSNSHSHDDNDHHHHNGSAAAGAGPHKHHHPHHKGGQHGS
jgi:hypothetical protein